MTSISLSCLRQHITTPCSIDTIKLKKWQVACALVAGAASSLLLIVPGFIAFYGISYYFKLRAVKALKKQDTLDGQFQTAILNKDKDLLRELLSSKNLDSLLKDRSNSELIEVTVEGKVYTLSKTLLELFIPIFKTMFTFNYDEAAANKVELPEIAIDEWENVLECLFFNQSLPVNETNILRYIYLADLFFISKLKKHCAQWIGEHLEQIELPLIKSLFEEHPGIVPQDAINKCVQKMLKHSSDEDAELLEVLSPFVSSLNLKGMNASCLEHLSAMPNLKALRICLSDAILFNPADLPQLDHFEVKIEAGGNTSLSKLLSLPITALDFSNIDCNDFQWKNFVGLNLNSLNLAGTNISDAGLELIATHFPNLKYLNLSNCFSITDKSTATFFLFESLETLNLRDCWLSGKATEIILIGLANLQHLSISYFRGNELLITKHLSRLKKLRTLSIHCHLSKSLFESAILIFLTEYIFFQKIRNKDIKEISKIKTLRKLKLIGCNKMTNKGVARLSSLPNLKDLTLERCSKVTDKGVALLARGPRLKKLTFINCNRITSAILGASTKLHRPTFIRCKKISPVDL